MYVFVGTVITEKKRQKKEAVRVSAMVNRISFLGENNAESYDTFRFHVRAVRRVECVAKHENKYDISRISRRIAIGCQDGSRTVALRVE